VFHHAWLAWSTAELAGLACGLARRLIVGAVVLSSLMDNPVEMRPLMVSKANTTAQIVLLILVLADLAGHCPAHSVEQDG
jgi:hypothetical protein